MVPRWALGLGQEGEGEHLGSCLFVRLHGHHGTQLGQWKQPFGHKLIPDIGVVIPAQVYQISNHYLCFLINSRLVMS